MNNKSNKEDKKEDKKGKQFNILLKALIAVPHKKKKTKPSKKKKS